MAYSLSSGVKVLEPQLQHFLHGGRTLRVLAGGDVGLTELWLRTWVMEPRGQLKPRRPISVLPQRLRALLKFSQGF